MFGSTKQRRAMFARMGHGAASLAAGVAVGAVIRKHGLVRAARGVQRARIQGRLISEVGRARGSHDIMEQVNAMSPRGVKRMGRTTTTMWRNRLRAKTGSTVGRGQILGR